MGNSLNPLAGVITIGPWGGSGGKSFEYGAEGGLITQIIVRSGDVVDSLVAVSKSADGVLKHSKKFGGDGGDRTNKVCFDVSLERLTGVDLTLGSFASEEVITSISFRTNMAVYGHFGSKKGATVTIPMKDGVIVGFYGRSGRYLNAIGIYAMPEFSACLPFHMQQESQDNNKPSISWNEQHLPRDPGPWGGPGGKHWDDGALSAVKQICVNTGKLETPLKAIHSVRFAYEVQIEDSPGSVTSPWHGGGPGGGGFLTKQIDLDPKSEMVIGIEGFYGPIDGKNGFEAITCIIFHTNKGKYGPFGEEIGTYFTSSTTGQVVGFFGRSGSFLTAIGVHKRYY